MNKIRVLLADDHLLAREGLRRILEGEEDLDCVAVADSGEQAVELTRKTMPDVAIIDVSMPGMSGIEATEKIKEISPKIAILIVSAYKYDHFIKACIEAGADGYLLKDNMLACNLTGAVRTLHKGESVFDHEVGTVIRKLTKSVHENVTSGELSQREFEILRLVALGFSNKGIASGLGIREQTVGTHLANIFAKLGVSSRTEAAVYAIERGWIPAISHSKPTI